MRRCLADHGVLLVLTAFFLARLPFLGGFMTHVDDIGPLVGILEAEPSGFAAQVNAVQGWTYAPAQFVVQALLLRLARDADGVIFWGRLPSLVAWWLGLVLAHRLYRAALPDRPWVADLLVSLQAVSWRGLIESSQGHNYATTGPVTAVLLLAFLRHGLEPRPLGGRLAAAWVGLGCLTWVTYQAAFVAAGCFVGVGALAMARGRLRLELPRLVLQATCFGLPLFLVHRYHLRHVARHGIAPWIPDPAPWSFAEAPAFLARAWFEVAQNVVTLLPWGAGSAALAAAVGVALLAGLGRRAVSGSGLDDRARVILALLAGIALAFSAGPVLHKFPLGETRHSYVLQVPLLLGLGLALGGLDLGRRTARALTGAVLVVGLACAATLEARTRRTLDLEAIESIAAADSQVVVVGVHHQCTWDARLLLRAHPGWGGRLLRSHEDLAKLPAPPARVLVIAHRYAQPDAWFRQTFEGYGPPETLQAVGAIGSCELAGNLNGGNGAFMHLLRRNP